MPAPDREPGAPGGSVGWDDSDLKMIPIFHGDYLFGMLIPIFHGYFKNGYEFHDSNDLIFMHTSISEIGMVFQFRMI